MEPIIKILLFILIICLIIVFNIPNLKGNKIQPIETIEQNVPKEILHDDLMYILEKIKFWVTIIGCYVLIKIVISIIIIFANIEIIIKILEGLKALTEVS